jgi:hypothetical protein
MGVRAIIVGLVLAVAAAAPSSAAAARAWNSPELLTTGGDGWGSDVAVAGNGDVIAAWIESDKVTAAIKRPGEPIQKQTIGSGKYAIAVAAGPDGSAIAAWNTAARELFVARRAPGGSFSPAERLPFNGNLIDAVTNASGGLAIGVAQDLGGGLHVSFGSVTGAIAAPVPIVPNADIVPRSTSLKLTARGEAIAAVGLHSVEGNIVEIKAGTRLPGDAAPQVQSVASAAPDGRMTRLPGTAVPMVGGDAAGNAVVGWEGEGIRYVERRAGMTFFGTSRTTPVDESGALALAMTDDGTVTLAGKRRVFSRRVGGTPKEIFEAPYSTGVAATSNGNHAAVIFNANDTHQVVHRRDGSGAFGPAEDLRPDCGAVHVSKLALGTQGHAAALISAGGPFELATDREAVPGDNDCQYTAPPAGPVQPFPLISTRVSRGKTSRTVAYEFMCGRVTCDASAVGRLQLRGAGVLARDIKTMEGAHGRRTIRLRFDLSKSDLRAMNRFRDRSPQVVVTLSARNEYGHRWESTFRKTVR